MIDILQAIDDPKLFGSLFKNPETWTAWRVFLRAVFGLPMGPAERELFKKFTARVEAPSGPFSEVFALVGRRGGKSFMSAVIACFLALFRDYRPFLSPGEIGYIMVIATDRSQARVILNYIKGILKIPMFAACVEKDNAWEIALNNQVTIAIKTCDYRSLRGFTVVAAICDELAFWTATGDNPAQEILTALRPALATVPESLLLGISTPYNRTGPLYESYREKYGQDDPHVCVWRGSTADMNPTIPARIIEKALKDDYSAARSEWLAEFRDDLESFLSTVMIEHAVVKGRPFVPPQYGLDYRAFVDPSGGKVDSMTLAIAHKTEAGKIIVDRLEEKRPPFQPQSVVYEFSQILAWYGVDRVYGDRWGSEWVQQAFKARGVDYWPSKLNKSEIYLEMEPIFAQGTIELPDNDRLVEQLKGLERRVRSGGKDSVDHFPGGHDDLANAVGGACVHAELRRGTIWTVM